MRERALQINYRISTVCHNVASGNITDYHYLLIKRFLRDLSREVVQLRRKK